MVQKGGDIIAVRPASRRLDKWDAMFPSAQLLNVVDITVNKWVGKGLDRDTLEKIRNTILAPHLLSRFNELNITATNQMNYKLK